jgi:hypothetical protein
VSLDKAWHGVHYLLCGEVEPGPALLSQTVLGGVELGENEGFSGYGPPRYFTPAQVAELSQVLNRPELETEAAAPLRRRANVRTPHLSRLATVRRRVGDGRLQPPARFLFRCCAARQSHRDLPGVSGTLQLRHPVACDPHRIDFLGVFDIVQGVGVEH